MLLCLVKRSTGDASVSREVAKVAGLRWPQRASLVALVFVWADVTFSCDYRRAVELAAEPPYTEVAAFLRRRPNLQELAFQTLEYFDCANHAPRVACPTTVTAGLFDPICPPSTIFGTFGRLATVDKELVVLPYHRHETTYEIEELRFNTLLDRLRPSESSEGAVMGTSGYSRTAQKHSAHLGGHG
jgi:pimeloyl-ACP methyl ester carboxylesterase